MRKLYLLFFFVLLAVLSVFNGPAIDTTTQTIICLILISLLGIPHGAIDHIIYTAKTKKSYLVFFAFYLGLMALYTVLWLTSPTISFLFFLAISAYHFGQSQFSTVDKKYNSLTRWLYVSWGSSVLLALLAYRYDEAFALVQSSGELIQALEILSFPIVLGGMIVTSIATLALMFYLYQKGGLKREKLFSEIYVLLLIHFTFYVFPVLIGFTIYFVILHSLSVLAEEYNYLKQLKPSLNVLRFIYLLMPFTLLSLVGSGMIIFLSINGWIQLSQLTLVFLLISILTLPHSVVMDTFYKEEG
ncbi:MAG: Brp/Blh family beta-carotene 15,15'-dioxygenase [Bacteroidota bacterium]